MTNEKVRQRITEAFPDADIRIDGDGCALCITVISEHFIGLNTLKRQQAVYRCLSDAITSGALHAVTLKTFTPHDIPPQG